MNIQKIKKAPQRIDVSYLATLGIKAYGRNNLYPQQAKAILDSSSTGAQCADRYARFIEGQGIANAVIYELEVNHYGETTDDILTAVAQDLANYGGFALHVNYDLNCKICEVQNVPFESCRLQEDDDSGYIAHIVTHPDWMGRTTRNGKILRVSKDTITSFDRFNPDPTIVRAQINACSGIDHYKGQILWVSTAGRDRYPLPKYDRVLTDLSTDEGLSNIKFRNARCNFLSSAFVISKKSQAMNEDEAARQAVEARGFAEDLAQFQGDETSNVLISLTVANDEEKPEIVEFPVKNFDKDFEVTDKSVVERIYSAFEQEPFLCIRSGKLGFSGTTIHDCYSYYSSLVSKEQRLIERAFSKIFDNWFEPLANYDCSIQPLTYNVEG
jgi:hypothetical protein